MSSTLSPREQLIVSIRNNDLPNLRTAIEALRHSRKGFDPASALSRAIDAAQPDIVRFLLENEGATVENLGPSRVSKAVVYGGKEDVERVERTWEVLLEKGWNVNAREAEDPSPTNGDRLLTLVCDNDRLVRWLLSHGATAKDPSDLDSFSTPPVLERVASKGSISTLKLLKERGTQTTRRVLHRAVEAVAVSDKQDLGLRMEMVRFLVEDVGCDVNAMDVAEGQQLPNHWGTPAAYATHAVYGRSDLEDQVAEVVGYLLEKGADPTIEDCWGIESALGYAKQVGNQKVLDVFREWERKGKGSV